MTLNGDLSNMYLTQDEMKEFEKILELVLSDTLGCWKRTRINGISASLACDGNISTKLLKAFDEVRDTKC